MHGLYKQKDVIFNVASTFGVRKKFSPQEMIERTNRYSQRVRLNTHKRTLSGAVRAPER